MGSSYATAALGGLDTSPTAIGLCHKDLYCVPGRVPESPKIKSPEM